MKRFANPLTIVPTLLLIFGLLVGSGIALASDTHAVKVAVGYADNLHNTAKPLPSPWAGSAGVIFIGTSSPGPWDAGAIKLENPSEQPLTVDSVTIDIGAATGINPWSASTPFTIPGKGTAILTQTSSAGTFNFDTSDECSPGGPTCSSASGTNTPGPCTAPSSAIPVVHVTVGDGPTLTKSFIDEDQVLNTIGLDGFFCFASANESHDWEDVHEGEASGM